VAKGLNRGLGIDFEPGLQEGLINNRGLQMLHEIGVACTCRVEDVYAGLQDDAAQRRRDPFCDRCGNDGWLFRAPALLTGTITGIRFQKNIIDTGIAEPGDAVFSPQLSESDCSSNMTRVIGANDKLTATWPEPLNDGHVLIRGAGSLSRNEGYRTSLVDNEDRLWYEPASAIWCEDEFDRVYKEGTDFELGPGRLIRWVGNQPSVGTRFSIKYNAYFEWLVFRAPMERRDRDGKNLGELVYLRKRHIAFVNTSPLATPTDKVSLKSRLDC